MAALIMARRPRQTLEDWWKCPDGTFCGRLFYRDDVSDGQLWKTSQCMNLDEELLGYVTTNKGESYNLGKVGVALEVEVASKRQSPISYQLAVNVDGAVHRVWRTHVEFQLLLDSVAPHLALFPEPMPTLFCMSDSGATDSHVSSNLSELILCACNRENTSVSVDDENSYESDKDTMIQRCLDELLNEPFCRLEDTFATFLGLPTYAAEKLQRLADLTRNPKTTSSILSDRMQRAWNRVGLSSSKSKSTRLPLPRGPASTYDGEGRRDFAATLEDEAMSYASTLDDEPRASTLEEVPRRRASIREQIFGKKSTSKRTRSLLPMKRAAKRTPEDTSPAKIDQPQPNQNLGEIQDFKLLDLVGRGSFGRIYLARKVRQEEGKTSVAYALKVLDFNDATATKCEKEAEVLRHTNHPLICKMYECFAISHNYVFALQYYNGGSLRFHLRRAPSGLPPDNVYTYGSEILCALGYLHENRIIYRDLKPDNVVLDSFGITKLTDFGTSKILPANETETRTWIGTPDYMAPEVALRKSYDYGVDCWAFGVTLFELSTGASPFSGSNDEATLSNVRTGRVSIPDKIPKELGKCISSCLVRNPERRAGTGDIQASPIFEGVDWELVNLGAHQPKFMPSTRSRWDTTNQDSL